ncbi:MAG TPA: SPOR domain-containing protein [Gammaproteobacteria bacterium]|nr:SPOR domain-containing protein [Gammaproteobacteria bacterium]
MEIGLKERLIGAVVLVILGVIIIPFFLKGSAPDSGVSQSVTLPPSAGTAAPQQYTMSLVPGAGTASPATAASTQAQAPTAQPPTARPAAAPAPNPVVHSISRTAETPPSQGKWLVQAGSYGSEANAAKVAHILEQHGYHASVSRFIKGGQTYYRVRVGPYAERSAADKAAPAVARAYGGKAEVVPNS